MAKIEGNLKDFEQSMNKLDSLASKLEKTNSNLGEKVGDVIKTQASLKITETELKTLSTTTLQQNEQLTKNLASLNQKFVSFEGKINQLKQNLETTNNIINIKINDLTQSIANIVARQDAVEKQLKATSEQIDFYNKEHSNDKVLCLIAFLILFLALGYRCYTLDKQVTAITEQLQTISSKLPQLSKDKDSENANLPIAKPSSENKQKSNKK